MIRKPDAANGKLAAVLIPVVVGGVIGLCASLATDVYSTWAAQVETIRKERVAHLERIMTLCGKYSNDLGKMLSLAVMGRGTMDAQSIDLFSAPSSTLLEMRVVVKLYFPALQDDVEGLFQAHGAVMQRLDEIIDVRGKFKDEDAAAFAGRMQKEMAPLTNRVGALMDKVGELAQRQSLGSH